jgi:hypothetical protein
MCSSLDSKREGFAGGLRCLVELGSVVGLRVQCCWAGFSNRGGGGQVRASWRHDSISLSAQNFYPWARRMPAAVGMGPLSRDR